MSEFVRLGDHIAIAKGKPPAVIPFDGPGAATYLTPEYLRNRASAVQALPGRDAVVVADEDVVLLWDGSNAGEFFRGKPGLAASTMARLRADQGLDRRYFVHALKQLEPTLRNQTSGTGIPHVDRGVLESLSVFRPPEPEQVRVADVLDTLDTTIRQTEAIIVKLKQVKQGLLHDLLTRGVDENGELRPPQSEAPHLYKESALGWIPTGWMPGPLGGWLDGRPKNGYSPQESWRWTGVQMLGLACLTTSGFLPCQLKNAPIGDARLGAAILMPGDLLISRANTRELVGLAGSYKDVGTQCTYPDLMMRLTPAKSILGEFMELALTAASSRQQIQALASGTSGSMTKISAGIVLALKIAVPGVAEQIRIRAALESVMQRLRAEGSSLIAWQATKTGLMADLLTGRVRVTPLLTAA